MGAASEEEAPAAAGDHSEATPNQGGHRPQAILTVIDVHPHRAEAHGAAYNWFDYDEDYHY